MPFMCNTCNREFAHKHNLKQHEKSYRCESNAECVDGKRKCPHCNSKFSWMTTLNKHIRTHHGENEKKPTAFSCGACQARFGTRTELIQHRAEEHSGSGGEEGFLLRESAHRRQSQNHRLVFPPTVNTMDDGFFFSVDLMVKLIEQSLNELKLFKISFTMFVEMMQLGEDGEAKRVEVMPFRTRTILARPMMHLLTDAGIKGEVAEALGDIERNLDEFLYQGSGWIVSRPLFMDAEIVRVRPLSGGGACGLHFTEYRRGKGIVTDISSGINEEEEKDDGLCFYKAVSSHLIEEEGVYLSSRGVSRSSEALIRLLRQGHDQEQSSTHAKKKLKGGVDGRYKVDLKRIPSLEKDWEKRLGLDIAIHVIYIDEEKTVTPLIASTRLEAKVNVVLAFFHTMKGCHFSLVKDPSSLFSRRSRGIDGRIRTYRRYTCYKCFNNYYNKHALESHRTFCNTPSGQKVVMPEEGDTISFSRTEEEEKFRDVAFQSGYVLIFDFETLQVDVENPCSCSAEVLKKTMQKEEEEKEWVNLSEKKKEEVAIDMYMEEGLQELWDREDEAAGIPKTRRRKLNQRKRWRKVDICPHKQKVMKEQKAFAYSYALLSRDGKIVESDVYVGEDAAENFIEKVLDISEIYLPKLSPGVPMEEMSKETKESLYSEAEMCYLCQDQFCEKDKKVLDHDHMTGQFLGVAHNMCNLRRKEVINLTCLSHNMSGYDSHLVIPKLSKFNDRVFSLSAIPLNTQKFKTFTINDNIVFLDSLAFLPDSLDKLVENLKASGSRFPLLEEVLGGTNGGESVGNDDVHKKLLLRKGVYPYSYATSIEALEECKSLPPKECFYNDLNECDISDEDYKHAQLVWDAFGCKSMMDYTVLYVRSDVILLAEAVMDMRNNIWTEFGLDMCAYLSLPMLAKDIMLKYTGAEIELISDDDMSNMIQASIRGGLSFINKRFAVRKDEGGNPKQLLYVDANNLYGDAMTFPLPYSDFQWMSDEEIAELDIENDITDVSGDTGYIFEVDLKYPEHLHDAHASFPLAPHSMNINEEDISKYSKECLQSIYGKKKHGAKKLVSTFLTRYEISLLPFFFVSKDKNLTVLFCRKNYVVHGLNLQLYKKLGMEIVKIHRAISFEQRDFIRPYIEMCTKKRKSAPTESLKNMYKLLCNALYGKMIEGVFGRMDVKFNRTAEQAEYHSSSPLFKGTVIFDENLSASFLKKKKVKLNQSWPVGFAILELSKYRMQKFFYETIQPAFGTEGCTVLMTDTDSFLLEVDAPTMDDAVGRIKHVMDFSNYPRDHPFFSMEKAKALGHLKNEVPKADIEKFVGLKSKTYMYLTSDKQTHVRAKGVKRSHHSSIKFEHMVNCLHEMKGHEVSSNFIRSKNHVIRLMRGRQLAFSSFDDKRYLLCPIHSVPYGSKYVPSREEEENGSKCPFC